MVRGSLSDLLGCLVPIQQAPMGAVSTPALAVAVANAGGIGTITALGLSAERLSKALDTMTSGTHGVLAVNFLTDDVDREVLEIAASRVPLVDLFWSDPSSDVVRQVHEAGSLVSWQVGSVDEARAAEDAGCDILIAQGVEAGGHVRGERPLLVLLSEVLDSVQLPVLAAGGIGSPRLLAAVIAAGAAGARIGTALVATEESGAHPTYKQAVIEAGFGETVITDAFALCPLCATSPRARVLRRCVDAVEALGDESAGQTMVGHTAVGVPKGSGMPPSAGSTGHVSAMAMYASDAAAAVAGVVAAADVVRDMWAGAQRLLRASTDLT